MTHSKKLRFLLVTLVSLLLVLSAVGIGVAMSRFSHELGTSILSAKRKKVKKTKASVAKIVAQLALPQVVVDPMAACLYVPQEKPEYKAEAIEDEVTAAAEWGGDFEATLYIKNTGNMTWFGDSAGCGEVPVVRLGTARDRDRASVFYNPGDPAWHGSNRIAMVEPRVEPGEIATFRFTSTAPQTDDIFREYFQPVVEGVKWMDGRDETASMDIYVGQTDAEAGSKVNYLGETGQVSGLDFFASPVIDVDISEQKLRYMLGDSLIREYTVSTGTFKTPTPLGHFKIWIKQDLRIGAAKPHYRMPQFMGFTAQGAGFHALPYLANDKGVFWNEALSHIGQRVSHGCVRILPDDAVDFYKLVELGTDVVIHA